MQIRREDIGEVVVLRLEGTLLGGPDATRVETAIADAVAEGRRSVLTDLARVGWVNSTGLGILIVSHARLKEQGGALKLLHVGDRIANILRTTQLDSVFETYADERIALESFS